MSWSYEDEQLVVDCDLVDLRLLDIVNHELTIISDS